jgi:hypothetical protein
MLRTGDILPSCLTCNYVAAIGVKKPLAKRTLTRTAGHAKGVRVSVVFVLEVVLELGAVPQGSSQS